MLLRTRTASAVLFAAILLPACGGSSSDPSPVSTPPPTPPPVVESVVASGSGTLPARALALIPFSIPSSGTLDVTVEWTLATNDVHAYLMSGPCTFEQFVALACTFVTFSESTTLKPERLRVVGTNAGSYTLGIGNVGPGEESVAFQVVHTTGGLRGQRD